MKTLDYKLLLLLLLPNMQSKLHNFGDAVEPLCVFLSPTEKKHFLPSDRECLFFLLCNTAPIDSRTITAPPFLISLQRDGGIFLR